jgi:hypothetical protein
MDDETLELDDEQVWTFGEKKANETFESLCVSTVAKTVGKVPVTKVSSKYYRFTQPSSYANEKSHPSLQLRRNIKILSHN